MMLPGGTPCWASHVADAWASVNLSPTFLEPVTTMVVARWRFHSASACSSRATRSGEGTPSYWAAPMTTMAWTGRAS